MDYNKVVNREYNILTNRFTSYTFNYLKKKKLQ